MFCAIYFDSNRLTNYWKAIEKRLCKKNSNQTLQTQFSNQRGMGRKSSSLSSQLSQMTITSTMSASKSKLSLSSMKSWTGSRKNSTTSELNAGPYELELNDIKECSNE